MALLSKLLGSRIKELRKLRGYTQAQLAELIGMETTNLCKLENGSHLPKEENIEMFASVLGVAYNELFDFGHIKPRAELENELINTIKNANDNDLVKYYKLINAVL